MDAEKIVSLALKSGADEVSVKIVERDDLQLRFSNNAFDISNRWIGKSISVLIAVKGSTTGMEIRNPGHMEEEIRKGVEFAKKLPKNPDFLGFYDGKTSPENLDFEPVDADELSGLGKIAMDSALEHDVDRVSGEIFLARHAVTVATNYNTLSEKRSYLITTVRAFNDEGNPGQSSTHIADSSDIERFGPKFVGDKAGMLAERNRSVREGSEGRFTVLFDPLCFGSVMTEVGSALSAFSVDSGTSFFVDRMGERVASEIVTVDDDPRLPGGNMGSFDDEGALARKTRVLEKGVLKSYLHTHSTAKKYGVESTGNAKNTRGALTSLPMGTLLPSAWQISVKPGKRGMEDILSDIEEGVYIANTWYTRYQNKRNGDFSTIPRDGIFYIKDGEMVEAWGGIRISENMLHLLGRIKELSSERIPADWWGETVRTFAPYALIDDVRITKAR